MYTYSGTLVDEVSGAPSIRDVAVVMGRLPRLCGSSRVWWTYLHHAFAMAEIALLENKHYDYDRADIVTQALVREAHAVVSLLWSPGKELKDEVQARIHAEWGVPYPHVDSTMRELLDRASARTFLAEVESFAPEEMKELPIFGEAPDVDCKILRGIWHRNPNPDDTAGCRSEMVKAYRLFFEDRDIVTMRHRVGYDKRPWALTLCA